MSNKKIRIIFFDAFKNLSGEKWEQKKIKQKTGDWAKVTYYEHGIKKSLIQFFMSFFSLDILSTSEENCVKTVTIYRFKLNDFSEKRVFFSLFAFLLNFFILMWHLSYILLFASRGCVNINIVYLTNQVPCLKEFRIVFCSQCLFFDDIKSFY